MPPRDLPREYSDDDIQIESDWDQVIDDFDKMGLKKNLLKGVYGYGLEKPSPVQQRAIMPLLNGRDLIMQAQSGTGKTAAFVIGILQKLDRSVNATQALILAPTRELAQQTQKVVLEIGQYMNIKCYACIGGTKVSKDVKKLESGLRVHVVVGTPGRLLDLIKRGALVMDKIKILCLDEADEMLSRGFKIQIMKVFEHLPQEGIQVVTLSATFPDAFHDTTKAIMGSNPVKILVKRGQLTLEGIKQFFIIMERPDWKLDTLCDLYTTETFTHPTVVFCNSRKKVDELVLQLEERELAAVATHGKKQQKDREDHLRDFRTGTSRVLISTDMLARGIDVQQVAVVINYDLPDSKEMYMHRIGRSGRFGRKGIAINFVTRKEISKIREIEEYFSTQIEEMPLDISILLRNISLST
ncbi:putative type III restriction enzyme, res subunit [Lyophyllum shimeji]|uniref:ATP-dependent RNA helicase FAL1 n=1 Tax=Lyophyllum shimeji TaxID=47721 RepID=A0A9P3PYB1_LYOSH|nr:putative type III restriction enzyme, res subunit [Lyophyllum shimeji]